MQSVVRDKNVKWHEFVNALGMDEPFQLMFTASGYPAVSKQWRELHEELRPKSFEEFFQWFRAHSYVDEELTLRDIFTQMWEAEPGPGGIQAYLAMVDTRRLKMTIFWGFTSP